MPVMFVRRFGIVEFENEPLVLFSEATMELPKLLRENYYGH